MKEEGARAPPGSPGHLRAEEISILAHLLRFGKAV